MVGGSGLNRDLRSRLCTLSKILLLSLFRLIVLYHVEQSNMIVIVCVGYQCDRAFVHFAPTCSIRGPPCLHAVASLHNRRMERPFFCVVVVVVICIIVDIVIIIIIFITLFVKLNQ